MRRALEWAVVSVSTWLFYALVFAIGTGGYLLLALWLPVSPLGSAIDLFRSAYEKVGITFPFLAGVSVYLLGIIVFLGLQALGVIDLSWNPRQHLLYIEEVSPMLGFLGTLVGLGEAMSGLETSKGMQTTVVWLTSKTGEAIWSSVYGAVQALVAYAVRFGARLDDPGLGR